MSDRHELHKRLAQDWRDQIVAAGGDRNVAEQAVTLAALNGLFDGYSYAAPQAMDPAWEDPCKLPDIPVGSEREFICAVYRTHSDKVYTFSATYLNAYRLNYEWGCPNEKSQETCDGCEDGCPTTGWFTLAGADDEGSQYHSLNLRDGDELRGWRALPTWGAAPPVRSAASTVEPADQGFLRLLVDLVWNHVTESQEVPATSRADELISKARKLSYMAAPTASPEPDAVREADRSQLVTTLKAMANEARDMMPSAREVLRDAADLLHADGTKIAALSRPAHGDVKAPICVSCGKPAVGKCEAISRNHRGSPAE